MTCILYIAGSMSIENKRKKLLEEAGYHLWHEDGRFRYKIEIESLDRLFNIAKVVPCKVEIEVYLENQYGIKIG